MTPLAPTTTENNERILSALRFCTHRQARDETTEYWNRWKDTIEHHVRGANVFEIGVGYNGGLYDFSRSCGAKSYVGVDNDAEAVRSSREKHPEGTFLHREPVHLLHQDTTPLLVVSSITLDQWVIPPNNYSRDLISAIAQRTPAGGRTIHWGVCVKHYDELFQNAGFIVEQDFILRVYRKK